MTVLAINSPAAKAAVAPVQRSQEPTAPAKNRKVLRKPGRDEVAIRVFFEVDGSGSFRAGDLDTANGAESAWMKPQSVIRLEAKPIAGHKFSHWVVQNEFAGSGRSRRVVATQGMVIRAVFIPLSSEDIRC